jgi:hypothetical protein
MAGVDLPMQMIIALILVFVGQFAQASDEWFCTHSASELIGKEFKACGVSEEYSEDAARRISLVNAQSEFYWFCEASARCKATRSQVRVEPKRMECETVTLPSGSKKYRCTRAVIFHLPE